MNKAYTTPSQKFALTGECDTRSHAIEISVDGGPYQPIADNCQNGTFAKTVNVTKAKTTFAVRAKGKFSYTDAAVAKVEFVLPPSAPFQTFVQSSASNASDLAGAGTQNAMGISFSGASQSSSQNHVETYLPGVVYGQ